MTDLCLRTTGLHPAVLPWVLKQVNSTALPGNKPVGRFLVLLGDYAVLTTNLADNCVRFLVAGYCWRLAFVDRQSRQTFQSDLKFRLINLFKHICCLF